MFNCLVRVLSDGYDEAIEISPNPPLLVECGTVDMLRRSFSSTFREL